MTLLQLMMAIQRDNELRYGKNYSSILDNAQGALATAEALHRNQSSKRDVSTYLKAAENRIAYVAGCAPLSRNIQERLQSLKGRLEKMQQRKEGMDLYTAQRLLEQALRDREAARTARKAKRFREAMDFAQRSVDAKNRVDREYRGDPARDLGRLYKNARHNNGKLIQSIRDEEYAHGHSAARACPAPAPMKYVPSNPVRNTNRYTGGNSPMLNVTTTTVQVIDGHVGQVWLNGEIVWQSKPVAKPDTDKKGRVVRSAASKAQDLAVKRVNSKFKDLLAS